MADLELMGLSISKCRATRNAQLARIVHHLYGKETLWN